MEQYLESTYSVNPFPDDFVRHRLHVVAHLPLSTVDNWFVLRCMPYNHALSITPQNLSITSQITWYQA